MSEPTTIAIAELLEAVSDRLDPERRNDVIDYLGHREWEIAADLIADGLSETDSKLDDHEKAQFRSILAAMDIPITQYDYLNLEQE